MIPRLSFFLCFMVFLETAIHATAYTWNGGTGVWGNPLMWSPNGVPGAGDAVTFNGGACTLDADVAIASLTITNGSIDGDFDIALSGSLTCAGGTVSGNGTIDVTGPTILNNVTSLFTRTVNMNGGGYTGIGGRFYTHANCLINLPAGQIFTLNTNGYTPWNGWPNNAIITIAGTLIKNGPGAAHFLYQHFHTTGTIVINNGSIDLASNGIHNGTDITMAGSTVYLGLGGGQHTFNTCDFSGLGTMAIYGNANVSTFTGNTWSPTVHLRMHDGTMTLGQDIILPTYAHLGGTLNGNGNVTVVDSVLLSNGTIGNNGTWNIGDSFTCSGGTLSGNGTVNVTGPTRLNNVTSLFTRTVNMNGGGYTGIGGRFYTHANCQINLPAGQTFVLNANSWSPWQGWTAGGVVNIAGTLIKNGAGNGHFLSPLVNVTGNIIINQGSIDLGNSGQHSGMSMQIHAGAYTTALAGVHNYSNCSFEGSGPYIASASATLTMSNNAFSPGISGIGILHIEKAGFLFPIDNLTVDINTNTGPGVGHDKLHIVGNVLLDGGTLNVIDNAAPDGNYTILSYTGSRTGTFSMLIAPTGFSLIYDDVLKTVILNKSSPPDNDGDGFHAGVDCDDSNPLVNPDAQEVCNGIDDDCDTLTDDEDPEITGQSVWYVDADLDGYGSVTSSVVACDQPDGFVDNVDDCDDGDRLINPGMSEICDGVDNDCDFETDEGWDLDGDGASDCTDGCPDDANKIEPGICGCGVSDIDTDGDGTADCNDLCPDDSEKIEPGICGCGASDVDTDEDGAADCNDACPDDPEKTAPGICGCGVSDVDTDGDGTADCNDACPDDPEKTTPGICGCGVSDVDTDGDGTADCNDACPGDPEKTAPGICGCNVTDADTDEDGAADCNDECPDDPEKTSPGICGCGVSDADSDGDGVVDCNDECPDDPASTVPSLWYTDLDGDGYGIGTPFVACGLPENASQLNGDCIDDDPLIYPTQIEVCNDVDDDCDGLIDDNDPDIDNQLIWYLDSDGDGYGDPGHSVYACYQPSNYVGNNEDCNDEDALISPRGTEICNDQDDNCDGVNDEGLECGGDDYDNDGVADEADNCQEVSNPDQADSDCDGVGNVCDVCPGGDDSVDNNNDGRPDCRYPPAYAQIVAEWKCGSKKVYICHGDTGSSGVAQTLCINYNAIGAHMAHGDYLGPCGNASCGSSLTEDIDMFEGLEYQGHEHASVHHEDIWSAWIDSEEMLVRPNPTTGITTVMLAHLHGEGTFNLYTTTGHVLYSQILAGSQEIEVDMSEYPAGIYIFDVMTAEGRWQKKVVRVG